MIWLLLVLAVMALAAAFLLWFRWMDRRGWARFHGFRIDPPLTPAERAHLDARWASVRNSYHRSTR